MSKEKDTVQPVGGNAQKVLREYAKSINNIQSEIETAQDKHVKPLREDMKAVYARAKAEGFDPKALKEAVRKGRFPPEMRDQIDLYEHAILTVEEVLD